MTGTLAIVGGGASLIGCGLGAEIDGHWRVVRVPLNHGDLTELVPPGAPFSHEDVGRRIDIAVVGALHAHEIPAEPGAVSMLWVYGYPGMRLPERTPLRTEAWRDRYVMPVWPVAKALMTYRTVQAGTKLSLKSRKFSRGTGAVVIALSLGYKDVSLYGFDNVAAGKNASGDPSSYPMAMPITGKIPAPRTHEYPAEKKLIAALAVKHGASMKAVFQKDGKRREMKFADETILPNAA